MAIHPLGLLTIEGSEKERALIENSLRTIRNKGTGEWCGHSFPALALIAARAGKPEMVWHMLQEYFFFINSNTLHMNGDPRQFGASYFTYDPMTVEGGFCFAAALQEMLLQSWNGTIRIFPAIPPFWENASFHNFLAEGGISVSAERRHGNTLWVELISQSDNVVNVKNDFVGEINVEGAELLSSGAVISLAARRNHKITISTGGRRSRGECGTLEEMNYFGLKRIPRF